MRIALVFPAPANPTYVPMGIAALAGHLRRDVPGCQVKCIDLNITTWEYLARSSTSGLQLERFLKGYEGNFYDQAEFLRHLMIWSELSSEMKRLDSLAKTYVETGYRGAALDSLLSQWIGEVSSFEPEVVCISIMYLQQVCFGLAFARALHEAHPGLQIVLGGAAVAVLETDALLQACPYVDLIVVGEGEKALTAIASQMTPDRIDGAVYRTPAGSVRNRPSSTQDCDNFAPADFSDFDLTRYYCPEPVLPALFSRGCRWRRCRFCAHNFSWGRYRRKDADTFVSELEVRAAARGQAFLPCRPVH